MTEGIWTQLGQDIDGKAKYEPKIGKPHNDHMISIETGKILEFDNDEIERLRREALASIVKTPEKKKRR